MGHDAQQVDLFEHGRAARVRRGVARVDREAFASAMVKHLGNRTKAAKEVGFSARTAYSQGSRLMRNPGVCRMVAAKARRAVEDLDCSAERILAQLTRIAFFDIKSLYAADGTLLPMDKWNAQALAAIGGAVETEEVTETEVAGSKKKPGSVRRTVVRRVDVAKVSDKVRCLELLGRHRKLFTDLTESTVKVTLEDLVAGE